MRRGCLRLRHAGRTEGSGKERHDLFVEYPERTLGRQLVLFFLRDIITAEGMKLNEAI
jgi:hypothetical protein